MTVGAIALATTIGALLGVGMHLVLPVAGATTDRTATDRTTTDVQVLGARLERSSVVTEVHRDRLARGVLRVESTGCGESRQATAILVRSGGGDLVLTNAHVVRGSGSLVLHPADGSTNDAQVRGAIGGRDAAVIAEPTSLAASVTAMPLGAAVQLGQSVVVAGYPAGSAQLLEGRVVSIEPRSGSGGTSEVLVIDAPARDGLSGSAVLDAEGGVVGLVAARDPSTGYVVAYPIGSVMTGTIAPIPAC